MSLVQKSDCSLALFIFTLVTVTLLIRGDKLIDLNVLKIILVVLVLSKIKKGMVQTTLDRWLVKPRTATRVRFHERVILKRITLDKESWTGIPLKGFSDPNSAFAKKRLAMKRRMAHDHYWRRQRLTPRNAKRVTHILKRMLRENTKLGY